MKTKLFYVLFLLGSFVANAQNLLYDFPFNNSVYDIVGGGTFSGNSGMYHTTDRHGNATGALASSNGSGLTGVTMNSLPTGGSARTVALWFKRPATADVSNSPGLFSYGSSVNNGMFGIYFNTSGHLVFQAYGNDAIVLNSGVSTNLWHHLAVTFENNLVKVYFNGNLVSTLSKALNTGNMNPFKLGNVLGHFDDLKIYDAALSAAQVEELRLYNNIATTQTTFPIEYSFNNTYNNVHGNTPFAASGGSAISFVADRNGNTNSAMRVGGLATANFSSPQGNSARTVSLWFKRTGGVANSPGLFAYGSSANLKIFGAYFASNGSLVFQAYGTDQTLTGVAVSQNTWHHLVVSYDGTSVKTYFNGQLTHTFPYNLDTGDSPFKLGNVEGDFDDLKIYDFALSDSQVLQLHNNNTLPLIIAEYDFDNTYNNVNGNTPFASNSGTSFTTDRHGNANAAININLTGTTATIPNLPLGNSKRAIAFWAKANVLYNDYNMTFSYGNSSTSQANGGSFTSNRVDYFGYLNNFYATATHTANTWYHFVYTYDGTTAKIYRNGVLVGSSGMGWNTTSSNNQFRLGIGVGNEYAFNGAIDDLKIYNLDLSATEVSSLYTNNSLTAENFTVENKIKLYPNPVNDILNIKTSGTVKSVEIFNTSGAKVKEENITAIDMKKLPAGMYMVKITDSEGKTITKKVIKN